MTKINFVSIYEFTTTDNKTGYLYTIKETDNDINYKYYSLTYDEDGTPTICEVKNALEQLIIEKKITLKKLDDEKNIEAITKYMEITNPSNVITKSLTTK